IIDQNYKMEVEQDSQEQSERLLSEEIKWAVIISIKYFNLSYRQIQEKFELSNIGTISKIWSKYQLFGDVKNNYEGSGGSNAKDLNEEIQESIQDLGQPKYSLTDVRQQLKNNYNIEISQTALWQKFQDLEMTYGKTKEIHALSDKNKVDRLTYCLQNRNNNLENIIFSDECMFALQENGTFCWFSPGQQKVSQTLSLSNKNKQIHVWGAVSWKGKSNLFIHDETVKQQDSEQRTTYSSYTRNLGTVVNMLQIQSDKVFQVNQFNTGFSKIELGALRSRITFQQNVFPRNKGRRGAMTEEQFQQLKGAMERQELIGKTAQEIRVLLGQRFGPQAPSVRSQRHAIPPAESSCLFPVYCAL
ncbi:hypothetical protein ABPG72_015118, partial [Tetrahymena utriculariae]